MQTSSTITLTIHPFLATRFNKAGVLNTVTALAAVINRDPAMYP